VAKKSLNAETQSGQRKNKEQREKIEKSLTPEGVSHRRGQAQGYCLE
jgi:hypothetical protein